MLKKLGNSLLELAIINIRASLFTYLLLMPVSPERSFAALQEFKIESRSIPRISVQTYYQGSIMPIYLTPGRSSVIDFPCQVTKASAGTGGDIHVSLATSVANEIDLALDNSFSHSTSLIVRCKEMVFVLDIIPSKTTHQEYVMIKEYRGAIKYYQYPKAGDDFNLPMSPRKREKIRSGSILGK